MPSVWALPPVSETIEADGILRLSTGQTFTLSNIPGNGWKESRLGKLTVAVQALIDSKVVVADLPSDDVDKTADAAELLGRYGGRRTLDGSGNLLDRSTTVSFEYRSPDEAGGAPKELIPTFRAVK